MKFADEFKTDRTAELDGVPVKIKGVTFFLARAGGANKPFVRALEKFQREYGTDIEDNTIEDEVIESELAKIYAKHVVKGWDDPQELISEDDGTIIPYGYDAAYSLLTQLPDLFTTIINKAKSADRYLARRQERTAKN